MTKPQRRAHALIWTFLTPALLAAIVWLVLARPAPPGDAPRQNTEARP